MYGAVGLNLRNFVFSDTVRNFGAAGLIPIFLCTFVGFIIYVSKIRTVEAFSCLNDRII